MAYVGRLRVVRARWQGSSGSPMRQLILISHHVAARPVCYVRLVADCGPRGGRPT